MSARSFFCVFDSEASLPRSSPVPSAAWRGAEPPGGNPQRELLGGKAAPSPQLQAVNLCPAAHSFNNAFKCFYPI